MANQTIKMKLRGRTKIRISQTSITNMPKMANRNSKNGKRKA